MVSKLVVVFMTLAAVSHVHGMTYQKAYQLVAEQGESLSFSSSNHGALCELIAVAKMQEVFPGARVESGIKYGPYGGNIRGELDVVVFREDQAMVIEVKCSKNFGSAASKADSQLKRFSSVSGNCSYQYWDSYQDYHCEQFQGQQSYHKMSYTDARPYGFDLSFDLSRSEILRLIDDLSF